MDAPAADPQKPAPVVVVSPPPGVLRVLNTACLLVIAAGMIVLAVCAGKEEYARRAYREWMRETISVSRGDRPAGVPPEDAEGYRQQRQKELRKIYEEWGPFWMSYGLPLSK